MICPECQTEAAPGAKFCRNCGEQLPDATTTATVETAAQTPPSASAQTVASPIVAPPKPTPDALPTVVGQAVAPVKPPEAFKTVAATAVPPPKPPESFKTVVSPVVPKVTEAAGNSSPVAIYPPEDGNLSPDDRSGNRFIRIILILAALGFLAGLAMFLAVYVFGEKPKPATVRVGAESLDDSIKRIELCGFWTPPNELNTFAECAGGDAFPGGVRVVALRLTGKLKPDSDCRVIWRKVESPVPLMAQSVHAMTEEQPVVRSLYQPDGKPLPTGAYVAEVRDGERPLARAYFTIGMQDNPR